MLPPAKSKATLPPAPIPGSKQSKASICTSAFPIRPPSAVSTPFNTSNRQQRACCKYRKAAFHRLVVAALHLLHHSLAFALHHRPVTRSRVGQREAATGAALLPRPRPSPPGSARGAVHLQAHQEEPLDHPWAYTHDVSPSWSCYKAAADSSNGQQSQRRHGDAQRLVLAYAAFSPTPDLSSVKFRPFDATPVRKRVSITLTIALAT